MHSNFKATKIQYSPRFQLLLGFIFLLQVTTHDNVHDSMYVCSAGRRKGNKLGRASAFAALTPFTRCKLAFLSGGMKLWAKGGRDMCQAGKKIKQGERGGRWSLVPKKGAFRKQ